MPLAQLADPWQKMPVGGTAGEVRAGFVCPHVGTLLVCREEQMEEEAEPSSNSGSSS